MTRRFLISNAADADAEGMAEYLSRTAGLESTLRLLSAALTSYQSIARAPGLGERIGANDPALANLRVRTVDGFKNILVVYRPLAADIEIVRGAARLPQHRPNFESGDSTNKLTMMFPESLKSLI